MRNLAAVSLDSDGVFGDDGGESQIGTATGSATKGYAVALAVGVDTRTTAGGGGTGAPTGDRPASA